MHNQEFLLESETHKLLLNFEIKKYLISTRQPDQVTGNNKKLNLWNSELCCRCVSQSKIKRNRKQQKVPVPCLRAKELWIMKVIVILIVSCAVGTIHKVLIKAIGRFGNKRISGHNLDDNIIKIGQNTEKSPLHLWELPVTKTSTEINFGVKRGVTFF